MSVLSPISLNSSHKVESNSLSTYASLTIHSLVNDRLPIARISLLVKAYRDEPLVGKSVWHHIPLEDGLVVLAPYFHALFCWRWHGYHDPYLFLLALFMWFNSSHNFVPHCSIFFLVRTIIWIGFSIRIFSWTYSDDICIRKRFGTYSDESLVGKRFWYL